MPLIMFLAVIGYSLALPYGEESNKIGSKDGQENLGSVVHGGSGSSFSSGGTEGTLRPGNAGFNGKGRSGGGFDRYGDTERNSHGGDNDRFDGNRGGNFGTQGSSRDARSDFGSSQGNLQGGSNDQGYRQGGDGKFKSLNSEVVYPGFNSLGESNGFARTRPSHVGESNIRPDQLGSSPGHGYPGVTHGEPSTHFSGSNRFPGGALEGNAGGAPSRDGQHGFHGNSGLRSGGYESGFGRPAFGGPGVHYDSSGSFTSAQGPYGQGEPYGQGRPYGQGGPHGGYKKYGY